MSQYPKHASGCPTSLSTSSRRTQEQVESHDPVPVDCNQHDRALPERLTEEAAAMPFRKRRPETGEAAFVSGRVPS